MEKRGFFLKNFFKFKFKKKLQLDRQKSLNSPPFFFSSLFLLLPTLLLLPPLLKQIIYNQALNFKSKFKKNKQRVPFRLQLATSFSFKLKFKKNRQRAPLRLQLATSFFLNSGLKRINRKSPLGYSQLLLFKLKFKNTDRETKKRPVILRDYSTYTQLKERLVYILSICLLLYF